MNITHKYVFVDLDECLLHTRVLPRNTPADPEKGEKALNIRGDSCAYIAKLRPGAKDLLQGLRMIVGELYVLTTSVTVYARHWNKEFELGFDPNKIYTREDMQDVNYLDRSAFPNGKAYLIDNLPSHENYRKTHFLKDIGELTYIKVPEYWCNPGEEFTPEMIQGILDRVRQ